MLTVSAVCSLLFVFFLFAACIAMLNYGGAKQLVCRCRPDAKADNDYRIHSLHYGAEQVSGHEGQQRSCCRNLYCCCFFRCHFSVFLVRPFYAVVIFFPAIHPAVDVVLAHIFAQFGYDRPVCYSALCRRVFYRVYLAISASLSLFGLGHSIKLSARYHRVVVLAVSASRRRASRRQMSYTVHCLAKPYLR